MLESTGKFVVTMVAGHPVIEVDGWTVPTDRMRIWFGDEKWLRVDRSNRRYRCRFGEGHLKHVECQQLSALSLYKTYKRSHDAARYLLLSF